MSETKSNSLIIPKLIVGLGNPEPKYDKTRHNIGFEIVDILAETWGLSWKENRRFQGLIAEGNSPTYQKIYLLKPLTYMNRSGQSVRAVTDWYKLIATDVLVIYDDMDLPIGRMRMRLSGSAGGHNGMKSIISHLGEQNFPRLRIGIGKSGQLDNTVSHVLGRFAPEERKIVDKTFPLVVDAIETSLKEGIEKAMSLFNSQTVTQ
ncbi:peptidyl-tRNA hydrolase [Crocosphaera subtropica ATCC 51142]|uniref:Peptidyl-tRNA hydrolase n=1 Tax=Crocosphaera subtropica (strain ATCC 51142 / BH68) TaxID=43989 RepID=B1WYT7_CROS5|nr:aminoacyl-tRNA hydrolase [Crocosphaera subtropica]ACB51104.1 peptidyl-tRNA hydrolase [Crocosphaera subtropica ATCC 51142]